jgi:hypothetical protein
MELIAKGGGVVCSCCVGVLYSLMNKPVNSIWMTKTMEIEPVGLVEIHLLSIYAMGNAGSEENIPQRSERSF